MKKALLVRQRDATDCGAACIASVCAYYNLKLRVATIRTMAGTDRSGTSVFGILEAATRLGLLAKAIRAPFENLPEIPLPAIAHVVLEERYSHYLVVVKFKGNQVVLMDPAEGIFKKMTTESFKKIWSGIVVLLIPGNAFCEKSASSNWEKFVELAAPHRGALLLALGTSVITGISGLALSVYIKKTVDVMWAGKDNSLLDSASVIILLLLVFHLSAGLFRGILTLNTSRHIDKKLILGYYRHLLFLPQRFFDTMRVGEIISRVNDAARISAFINEVAVNMLLNTLMVVFSLTLMIVYNLQLALVMISSIPFYGLLFYLNDLINVKWQRKIMENAAAMNAQMVEALSSATTIKKLILEKYTVNRTDTLFSTLLNNVYRSTLYQICISGSADFLTRAFTVIILWTGSYYVLQKQLSPGELISFYSLIGFFTAALMYLLGSITPVRETLVAADRLFEIMDLEMETSGNMVLKEMECIRFMDVDYGYGHGELLFKGLNFSIRKGTITGIAGESGMGKSTIAALLQKLYLPSSGKILINNEDIINIDNYSLRKIITAVPQHTHLFSVTLAENIAIGSEHPDMDRILELSRRLGITEFAEKMPLGFFTVLEEQAGNLSGGQKQKISIARALYREPPVLILDEATASLDAVSENQVLETMRWYRDKGNTIIIIAHKDSTLRICDTIIVIQDGQIL